MLYYSIDGVKLVLVALPLHWRACWENLYYAKRMMGRVVLNGVVMSIVVSSYLVLHIDHQFACMHALTLSFISGIVVPGKGAKHDPTNLCLLEATSGSGITCHPLLTRLEMSRSRSVILLPLSCPGEHRYHTPEYENDEEDTISDKTRVLKETTYNELTKFRDKWLSDSLAQNYKSQHSYLSIMGSMLYLTGLYPTFPIPISPSAWIVVQAVQECGAAMKLNDKVCQQTKVEDFTRDGRFYEKDCVRLRPGWKFLAPVVLRETSVS
jgi:hypothetical protein